MKILGFAVSKNLSLDFTAKIKSFENR